MRTHDRGVNDYYIGRPLVPVLFCLLVPCLPSSKDGSGSVEAQGYSVTRPPPYSEPYTV